MIVPAVTYRCENWSIKKVARVCAKSLQLCPTVCNPMDYSLSGSSVHGLLQAEILEWAAMSSCSETSQLRD